jgi:hypothetical protein
MVHAVERCLLCESHYVFKKSQYSCFRDLGTEGAFDSDVGLRKCLSGRSALIPGPRYYCATRALISTGSYGESLHDLSSENFA